MDGGGGGGGHMPGEETEKLMDDYLKSIGLHRKKIAKDGSCLFRAVAEQVLHCQSLHTKVRAKCVDFLKRNRESYEAFIEGDFEDYLWKLQDPQQWVGEVEINALAAIYKRDFLIFQEPGKPPVNITDNNFKDKVRLCFLNGNHYDSIYSVGHIKNAALCQSILYEVLYDGVFNVDRGSLGMCQRAGRASDFLSDDNMVACPSSDESDPDAAEELWVENGTRHSNQSYRGRGRGRPLPERVRRSLNPTLLRNIEFDVWHKSKRAQQKMDFCIAAGMQYTVGDRCQVRLEGRSYNATVKEVPTTKDNMVTVHMEELGKRHVPLWSLRPPSDDSSWSTVVNKDKRLSNGYGEWEERGKGRGRGKPVPPPPPTSAPQAAAPVPSGRVQKQHSWPPQATVEEQGGAKPSRKSMSAVDSASFGLTEEQRLAKEEEERNVALVEIQLRDENSFPALGTQGDGGRKKMAQRKRSQRNKTISPVEDVRAASPSAGERPKSSTPPPATTATAAPAAPTNPTLLPAAAPTNPTLLPAAAPTNPTLLPAAAAAAAAAPATKTNAQRSSPPLPAAAAAKPPVTGGAPPPSVPCSASVFSFLTPVLPTASSPALSSPPPPSSSASPPPPSLVPQPTFIAPIALSPGAAQGFHPPSSSSLHRTSPPVPSLPHSPSPPHSSSSLIHPPASRVRAAPPAAAQTPNALTDSGGSLTKCQASQSHISVSQTPVSQTPVSQTPVTQTPVTQTPVTQGDVHPPASLPKIQPQIQASLPQSPVPMPQTPTENQSSIPQHQSLTEVSPKQIQASVPQSQPQVQSDMVQMQASHPPPGASYPLTPQASVPGSAQPPHPSQLPHPSLCVSASPTHPSLPAQSPDARIQTEAPRPPTQPPSQQPHPPAHHPQSIPGPVPLQNLAQLYLDPLYPGFPQGETGDMAQTPSFSSNRSGDDLPQDVNILRFFFNLGVKAYSMPLFPPYLYLLPLQHAHTLQPRPLSRSPSPHCPPTRHQEPYPQYPATPQYGRQAPPTEPPRPSEPPSSSSSFIDQAGYPVAQPPAHRMPCAPLTWQQQHQAPPPPPANSGYPVGYPSPAPPYPLPPPSSQGYHPAQGTGHPLYPPTMPPYPLSSLGYQSSSTPDEHQGAMEQLQPPNGDAMSGRGPGQGPGPLEGPAAAHVTNANNNNRAMMLPGVSFALKEQGESLTRTVLLVDPPLNNRPILALVPNSCDPVSMAAMNPSSSPGSPSPYGTVSKVTVPGDSGVYRVHPGHFNPGKTYVSREHHPPAMPTLQALSVGCSTEDNWEEPEGFKPSTLNNHPRGPKRPYRGGRGRGGGAYDGGRGGGAYDGGRGGGAYDGVRGGHRRRQGGEGYHYAQYGPTHRGRGW